MWNIDRDSWHYRWSMLFFNSTTDNFCTYFWRVILTGVFSIVGITVVTAFGFWELMMVALLVLLLTNIIVEAALGLTLAMLLVVALRNNRVRRVVGVGGAVVTTGFVAMRQEAKRRGICPKLNYGDWKY